MRVWDAGRQNIVSLGEEERISRLAFKGWMAIYLTCIAIVGFGGLLLGWHVESSRHRDYHIRYGIVAAPPVAMHTLHETDYLTQIAYNGWYGTVHTVPILALDDASPGTRVLVVVSRNHQPWIADDAEAGSNPRNVEPTDYALGGAIAGMLLGVIIALVSTEAIETKLINTTIKKRKQRGNGASAQPTSA